ncbi:phage head closure protein [Ancylobacter pratisalsi]|uniref:Phage head closure protein n=1 Tax=Ancylobacter pratisalsi TaxID=1745854 RepID=A0A6P1YHA9_9HYPH|nr:phage head closure protein [Ancylobacter pratisalsi]QIB32639.1 phage head closure protein [Ancylobacter pratisalsi]
MTRAGDLNKRARFERSTPAPDGAGGNVLVWSELITVWAQFSPERARERLQAGRLASMFGGVVRIRSSQATREITQKDRVVLDGVIYNIRSVANPDQRHDMLEMGVEADGTN